VSSPKPPLHLPGPVVLLASDAGSYVSSTKPVVDGGWVARYAEGRPKASA
jgi:hypothetical protein